jgi:release factor glutamine methyltransferase
VTTVDDLTVAGLRRRVAARIGEASHASVGSVNAALDSRLIVAHVLRRDAANLVLVDRDTVDAATEARALALADRRGAGEPVARLVGRKEFWGLDLLLSRETLVPRPDTETVVSGALAFVDRTVGREATLSVLDLGTGSGAILLAILSEMPNAIGVGSDVAVGALETAQENARRLGLTERASFTRSNWGDRLNGSFDVIVSNPPYVESGAIAGLPVEVKGHDPHVALDGGQDGLGAYRELVPDLGRLLAPAGRVFLEVGAGQAASVARIAVEAGFGAVSHRDLAGVERVLDLVRKPLA